MLLNGYSNDTTMLYAVEQELEVAKKEDPDSSACHPRSRRCISCKGGASSCRRQSSTACTKNIRFSVTAALWRAILAWLEEDNATAKSILRTTLEREPLFAPARMFLGDTLRTEGDVAGATREHAEGAGSGAQQHQRGEQSHPCVPGRRRPAIRAALARVQAARVQHELLVAIGHGIAACARGQARRGTGRHGRRQPEVPWRGVSGNARCRRGSTP